MGYMRGRGMRQARSALAALLLGQAISALAGAASAQDTTLTIESWRVDDLTIWQDRIIPAFEARHPDIKVVFAPTRDSAYDAALDARLEAGSAGDLIACRPFAARALHEKGRLATLDLPGMENFSEVARLAWSTEDGETTFCVPMASVIHGFVYNKDVFDRLGIAAPRTEAEFFAALDKIEQDGDTIPLAMGTQDQWEPGVLGYQNIGPNSWKGEEGRAALAEGDQKFSDPQWIAPFAALARWKDFLGEDFEARSYADSQNLFATGRAAIYPAGSWEVSLFRAQARFELGAFPPPVKQAGDTCYIADQPDIGLGLNAASANADGAKTFLAWVASPDFAALYANALPGFFSPISAPVQVEDPLAREFLSWRQPCQSTLRPAALRPDLDRALWRASVDAITGARTPQQAGDDLQKLLDDGSAPAR